MIIEKVYQLYGALLPGIEIILEKGKINLPAALFLNAPKISKGENYQKLPWVMLDYPRYFAKDDMIALRTFFWWGHFFSVNLLASGSHQQQLAPVILHHFEYLQQNDYWICINESAWDHHFENDNFIPLQSMQKNELEILLLQRPFIKIAARISVQQWTGVPAFIIKNVEIITELLQQH